MMRKVLLIVGALMLMSSPTVYAAVADLPQTGQTACYDTAGTVIPCAGTSQDGDLQKGIAWQSPRFEITGDSTCRLDTLTGLLWMQDPGVTAYSWQDALNWANGRNAASLCGYSSGWRLPNVNELISLLNQGGTDSMNTWLIDQGFTNIGNRYWSSTNYTPDPTQAWAMDFNSGYNFDYTKNNSIFAWPVRGPDTLGPAPVRKTGQISCWDGSGNPVDPCTGGQDGEIQAGVAWPAERFSVDGDCVTDNLTELVWAATPTGDNKNWQEALDYANGRNAADLCGYSSGWRLPNMVELNSLVHYGQSNQSVWLNTQGFTDVLPGGYWSSTSFVGNRNSGMDTAMSNGQLYPYPKNQAFQYAWAVRDLADPDISLSPGSLDFGVVVMSDTSLETITITNTGTADLVISTIEITGTSRTMFDAVQGATNGCAIPNATVTPGESCTLDVTFTPDALGAQDALLYINSTDPDTPQVQVSLLGNGVTAIMTPTEGTTGTQITITGTGFGDKKGKVLIGSVTTKVTNWTDTQITCTVKKVPLPVGLLYDVTITTKTKEIIPLDDAFTVKNPELDTLADSAGRPGEEITVTGNFFGIKKGKVYLEYLSNGQTKKKNCKVTWWYMNPTTGASEVRFIVPKVSKTLPAGDYPLKVYNKIGTATADTDFTILP